MDWYYLPEKIIVDDTFEIPVSCNGKEFVFTAKLLKLGYTYKIEVDVNDCQVLFEPDEERNYRAVIDPMQLATGKKIDVPLIKAIAETLESIRK